MGEICNVCHRKPATNHLCEIKDGEMTTRDLCNDCLHAHRAATGYDFPILDGTQRCYYCGAPARSGGTNLEREQSVRGERFHFTCFRCSGLYHEFITASLANIPKGLTPQEEMDACTGLVAEADKRVRERVGER